MNEVNDGEDLGKGRETGVPREGEQRAQHALRTVGSQGVGTTSHPLRMQSYTGVVKSGSRRGTDLGYPTINIPLIGDESGIFAAKVVIDDKEYLAAVFADPKRHLLEAHILDFSGDVYGKSITMQLFEKLRDTANYANDADLKAAIARDVENVRDHFSRR